MESAMKFEPGTYYVGDPGFVLPNPDLRTLFSQYMHGTLKTGVKKLIASQRWGEENSIIFEHYWIAKLPNMTGTLYDGESKGWGFDWGCFGLVPWEWATYDGCYDLNKFEFKEPFECSFIDNKINISHLNFTL